MVQLKHASILFALVASSLASPVVKKESTHVELPLSARQVASCETQTAAEQVACIEACNGSPGCIVGCTATAVDGYVNCAKP